jgi:hypothetical protein
MTAPSQSTQESTPLVLIGATIAATARRWLCYLLLWWLLLQISAMDYSYSSWSRFLSSRPNLLVGRISTPPTPETAALCATVWRTSIDAVLGIVFGIYSFLGELLTTVQRLSGGSTQHQSW